MKILWTDGSASPNPGPGGFAVICNGRPVVLGKENPSTNIRMEGLALVAGMEYVKGEFCEIRTDSEFWVNVVTKWMKGWKERGWKKASKGEIQNLDIVKKLDSLYDEQKMKLVWVKGHVGTEMNELADEWANRARKGESLLENKIK